MPKLTILRGVSGSGKSTWARQQNAVVVSRDDLRVMMFGSDKADYYAVDKAVLSAREQQVTVACNALIAAHLKAGSDVVVDNTNIEWKYVKQIAKIGYRYDADVEVKVFDCLLRTAIMNDENRKNRGGRYVGEAVIKRQHERFQKNKSMTLDPVQPVRPYNGTPGKKKAFLVDIDGTLAHMRDYRGPFEWHNVGLDDVDDIIANIVEFIRVGSDEYGDQYNVIIMSGRDESCRSETEDWLYRHGILYGNLYMRPAGDMRPDNIIKAELFDNHIRDWFDVKFVIDDRRQVVEMWQRMGLKVLNVSGLDGGDF